LPFHDSLYQKTTIFCRAESVVSAQLYIYAHRRFSAASAFDLQRIEKDKTERFTELIFLFFIQLNAERFTESPKHKRNDLQNHPSTSGTIYRNRRKWNVLQRTSASKRSERKVLQNIFACFSSG